MLVCTKEDALLEAFKAALISLEGSRVSNLLAEYRRRHGRQAREAAFLTYHRWREGQPAYPSATTTRLFDLLPQYLNEYEELTLLKRLRMEALERVEPVHVHLIVAHPSEVTTLVSRVLPLLRRVEALKLPAASPFLYRWLSGTSTMTLARVAEETDRLLAAQRLADLIVCLSLVYRLRTLTGADTQIAVTASFVIPTATIIVRFRQSF